MGFSLDPILRLQTELLQYLDHRIIAALEEYDEWDTRLPQLIWYLYGDQCVGDTNSIFLPLDSKVWLIEWRTSYAFWVIMNGCPSREISRVAFAFPHMYGIASKGGASVNLWLVIWHSKLMLKGWCFTYRSRISNPGIGDLVLLKGQIDVLDQEVMSGALQLIRSLQNPMRTDPLHDFLVAAQRKIHRKITAVPIKSYENW